MAQRRKIAERAAAREIPGAAAADTVFAEPWQARAFAIAVALSRAGRFAWDEFRAALIAEIAAADADHAGDAPHTDGPSTASAGASYYESWLAALERVIRANGLLTPVEIERRAAAIAASPPAR